MDVNTTHMVSLNESNYSLWKGKMEDLFYVKKYHEPVFVAAKPTGKIDDVWTLLHRNVCGYIRQWVDDNVINHISGEKNAKSLWDKIEQMYAKKTGNNKMFLIKKMFGLNLQEWTSCADHLNTFQGIMNKLSAMSIKFDDEIQRLFLLGSLPNSWETFRMSSNSDFDGVLSMDLVKSSVLNEEMRRKSQDSSSESGLLVTESRGRNVNQYLDNRDQNRSNSKKVVECYNCGKKGHKQRFCWSLKKENEDKGKGKKKKEDSDCGSTNLAYDDEFLLVEEHDIVDSASSWVIDSGTSIHITSRRDVFCSYTLGEFGDVNLANEGELKCVGLGDVNLEMSNGEKLTLKDVKHVPVIRLNLLYVAKLCDEGYDNLFSRDS